jgi:hypothetical protein
MTEALKTDWLEQAKREIAEQFQVSVKLLQFIQERNKFADGLVAERARNLELREQIEKLKTAANAWKGSSDGWDSWG